MFLMKSFDRIAPLYLLARRDLDGGSGRLNLPTLSDRTGEGPFWAPFVFCAPSEPMRKRISRRKIY